MQQGHCHTPMSSGMGSISPPHLTPTVWSDYGTPSLSPSSSPEENLVNPMSSLGLDPDCLANFESSIMSYPKEEGSLPNRDEKPDCPVTVRRARRREQNRESYVIQEYLDCGAQANRKPQSAPVSGPERHVYKATREKDWRARRGVGEPSVGTFTALGKGRTI